MELICNLFIKFDSRKRNLYMKNSILEILFLMYFFDYSVST